MNDLPNSEGAWRVLLCSTPFPFSLLTSAKDARYCSQPPTLSALSVAKHRLPLPLRRAAISSWHRRTAELEQKPFFFFFCLFFFLKLAYPSANS